MRTVTAWPDEVQERGRSTHAASRRREVVSDAFAMISPSVRTIAALTIVPLAGCALMLRRMLAMRSPFCSEPERMPSHVLLLLRRMLPLCGTPADGHSD